MGSSHELVLIALPTCFDLFGCYMANKSRARLGALELNWAAIARGTRGQTLPAMKPEVQSGEEAVYAFKDEKPATFAKFSILVDSSYGGKSRN